MEDYIFLIIAVAISIFAAINKNRKKQQAEQFLEEEDEETASERRNRFMDQLLGEDFLEPELEKPAPPKRVQSVPSKAVFKSSKETSEGLNYQLPRFKSTLPDRPKHTTITTTRRQTAIEEPFVELEEGPGLLEDFSLRKAIVYSQIIEPKYEW